MRPPKSVVCARRRQSGFGLYETMAGGRQTHHITAIGRSGSYHLVGVHGLARFARGSPSFENKVFCTLLARGPWLRIDRTFGARKTPLRRCKVTVVCAKQGGRGSLHNRRILRSSLLFPFNTTSHSKYATCQQVCGPYGFLFFAEKKSNSVVEYAERCLLGTLHITYLVVGIHVILPEWTRNTDFMEDISVRIHRVIVVVVLRADRF